jgi:hypothetical protein
MYESHVRHHFLPGTNFSVLGIKDVYPSSKFFHPRSRVKKIPNPGSALKNLSIFNPKTVCKLMEKLSGMFIPDPGSGSGFFHIPDPGVESTGYRIRIRNTDFYLGTVDFTNH